MTDAFPPAGRDAFAALYPETPGKVTHGLSGHPLLEMAALVRLAQRIRPVDVECNLADLPIGVDPKDLAGNGLSIEETLRSIESAGSWMVIKFIEQDAEYRAFLHDILGELADIVGPRTGEMLKLEGFIFVSSPGAVTPFHMDPEHNILLQCRGTKTMTVFPTGDREIAGGDLHERFHAGHHRNLPWQDHYAERGTAFALAPGEGIHVPVKAPHFVRNGPDPSVSLSVTWRSEWSFHEEYAHNFNAVLRKAGFTPQMPGRFPEANRAKSVAWRAIDRVGRVLGRE